LKRLPWTLEGTKLDLASVGIPDCCVLVAETDDDRAELLGVLDGQGVVDGMSFTKGGVTGTLIYPEDLLWLDDGAIQLAVSTPDGSPRQLWFWIVEITDASPRRFVWWGTMRDQKSAWSWS